MAKRAQMAGAAALGMFLMLGTWSIQAAEPGEGQESAAQAAPAYPTSVKSMIERRREAMEKRREQLRDAMTGRRWHQPPWMQWQDDRRDQRKEAMDEQFRRHRDAAEARRNTYGMWNNPWTQQRKEWAEVRKNAFEADRLRREEYFDNRFSNRPMPHRPWGLY